MKNPLILLIRQIALCQGKSNVPTKLLPLSQIREAVVVVDASEPDSTRTEQAVIKFFADQSIACTILGTQKPNLNYAGYFRKKVRLRNPSRSEQLFISLVADPECFAAEYEARCSRASFKIGCCLYRHDVFDLRYTSPESGDPDQKSDTASQGEVAGTKTPQSEVFDNIAQFLKKII